MTRDEELLLEQVTSAHRERAVDGTVRAHPAWHDLGAEARRSAFDTTWALRKMEAALDPEGRSTTVKAVLARILTTR
ncbi:MAG: hypothetical protein ACYC8T_35735 [Myxococcaceae bacterium]